MASRRLWSTIKDLTEDELRLQVVIPLLRATHGVKGVTDVHGVNEKGLDIVFLTETDVETICYGLQLKRGNIGGGGTNEKTVQQIVDQLELAENFQHPVVTKAGTFQIDRFIVATSGTFSSTAREEITRRMKPVPVKFWDRDELIRRIHADLPGLFEVADGEAVGYLKVLGDRYVVLDSLDQIPGVARRTLPQVFVEPHLRRKFDPTLGKDSGVGTERTIPALSLIHQGHNAILLGDQDGGKTTILRMIAVDQAQRLREGAKGVKVHSLPVLIRAKDILGSLTIEQAIEAEFRRLNTIALCDTLAQDLEVGNYLLLIDGFSEFTKDEDKSLLSSLIEQFAEANPEVLIVVAARPVDFLTPKFMTSFHQYTIQEFDDSQVKDLLRRWTGDSATFADVAEKMAARLREALQLPGSPIPATIGVMIHEEQNKFITNTAEAIDRYMVIRLGRYAHELGMKQQVEWTRKQDMLAEVAFAMVEANRDAMSAEEFIERFDDISRRKGDECEGSVVFRELVESGVLVQDGDRYDFHRTSFRDFFAGHHLFRGGTLDSFAAANAFDRRWGGAIVFAAGIRRNNSQLLMSLSNAVNRNLSNAIGEPSEEYFYGAYLCGRVLSNSEGSDREPRIAALEAVLEASARSIPGFERIVVEKYGRIGQLMALIGAEHSFFVTVGVPWLRQQLQEVIMRQGTTDEERFILASTYAHLGFDDCFSVLQAAVKETRSLRAIVALDLLVQQLEKQRPVSGEEGVALSNLKLLVKRRLSGQGKEIDRLFQLKSKVLEVERKRMRRIMSQKKRES